MARAQNAHRARNPSARSEFVDPLTGERVSGTTPGAVSTGRKVMRIRPRADAPLELVTVDAEDLDPSRDRFGVEPSSTARYRQIAQEQSRRGRALERYMDLHGAGISTTFTSPKAATKSFMENNLAIFDDPSFEDVDAHDITKDFMDRLEVRSGNRFVRLSSTRRGEQILSGGPQHSGSAIAREMLTYLFGQAGKRRRWRDVPWTSVFDYVAMLRSAMELEAKRRHIAGPSSAPLWVPLASGQYSPDEMLVLATEHYGEASAERLADWLNSQALYDLADRLTAVLSPPKGVPGARGRRVRRCLGKEARKTVAARRRQIEHWAAFPREIPKWTCVSTQATETSSAGLCLFPGLAEEVSRVEHACDRPYDPSWPTEVRNRHCAEGLSADQEQFGTGIAPLGCDDVPVARDDLELPWENNPPELHLVQIDPRLLALQRTLERGGWEIDDMDIDMARQTARIQLRSGDRLVTFDARNGRASTTREIRRRDTVPVGRKGDRFQAERIETEFLGRQKHEGIRSGLRWLSNYLADNSSGALTSSDVRAALGPVMSASETPEQNPRAYRIGARISGA